MSAEVISLLDKTLNKESPASYRSEFDFFLESIEDRVTDLQSIIEDAQQRLRELKKIKSNLLESVTLSDVNETF